MAVVAFAGGLICLKNVENLVFFAVLFSLAFPLVSAAGASSNQGFKVINGVKTNLDAFSVPTTNKLSSSCVNKQFTVGGVQEIALNVGQVKAIAASGSVELLGDNSLARLILVDSKGNEKLLFEAYSALDSKAKSFAFNNLCEETCAFDAAATPAKLRIQIENAKLSLGCFSYLPAGKSASLSKTATQLKAQQNAFKISAFNDAFALGKQRWQAGDTGVSSYSYAQKKKLFAKEDGTPVEDLPNLQGFEYYKSGVFEFKTSSEVTPDLYQPPPRQQYTLPSSFDWRNRHAQNWVTSVKNQGSVGTCSGFAEAGAFEAQINLYYNQHLNADLSEQARYDAWNRKVRMPPIPGICGFPTECLEPYPAFHIAMCKNIYVGLVDEECDPYEQRTNTDYCYYDYICSNWANRRWKIFDYRVYTFGATGPADPREIRDVSKDEFKKTLIKGGPMYASFIPWWHAMVLVGYEELPGLPQTAWIFKNSWGWWWGENGYGRIAAPLSSSEFSSGVSIMTPITPPLSSAASLQIACVDIDHDEYCSWGITEQKPSSCPAFCKPEADCDDSNPDLGPFVSGNNLNCKIIGVTPTPSPSPIPGNCTDSDGGIDEYSPGLCRDGRGDYADDCLFQSVHEAYCDAQTDECKYIYINCPPDYVCDYRRPTYFGACYPVNSPSPSPAPTQSPEPSVKGFGVTDASTLFASAPPEQQNLLPYWTAGIAGVTLVVAALAWRYQHKSS